MKTLVVYANPNMGGHCHAILESVKQELASRKIEYDFVDLNAEKFDPVISAEELYTSGGSKVNDQTKKYMDQLAAADKIIYIYPIWWNSMPAIVKGYFDKVMAGRFAFRYIKKPYLWFAYPVGLLTGKKAVVFVTTGARWWMTGPFLGNRYKKIIVHDILEYCGLKAKLFSLHNCLKWEESRKPEVEKLVKHGLNWLY